MSTRQRLPPSLLPRFRTVSSWRAAGLFAFVWLAAVLCAPRVQAETATVTTLLSFNINNGDGPGPLVQGSDGYFYGATSAGGDNNNGTVFRITKAGVLTTLHSFNGDDGNQPGPLIQGNDGDLYGTTYSGGSNNYGTVFRVTKAGALTTLHSFNGSDGYRPGPLVQGSDGNFYGTANSFAGDNGDVVFCITATGTLSTVHHFSGNEGTQLRSLVQGSNGDLYGTTNNGGDYYDGTVFRLTTAGVRTTLHSFSDSSEGTRPGSLVQGSNGSIYGNTFGFAYSSNYYSFYGEVFRVTPGGLETTLHAFSASEGLGPASLVQGSDGNLYGLTYDNTIYSGFPSDVANTVFRITTAGVVTTIYNFNRNVKATLVQGSDGNLYGTTYTGGDGDHGTVFRLALPGVGPVSPNFFTGQASLGNGAYYLSFSNGDYFGYYSYLSDTRYIYHFDLGYEYVFDANDGKSGVYFYDFKTGDFFYTSPIFPFPCLYDFTLNTVLYYYPDPNNAGHYNTSGIRYFYDFATGKIIIR